MLRSAHRSALKQVRSYGYVFTTPIPHADWLVYDRYSLTTLLTKIRVQSERTCCRRVTMAVSCFKTLCTVCTAHVSPPAAFNVPPLGDYVAYAGPSERKVSEAGACWCNTVLYNLLSACSECQGGMSISYVFDAITAPPFSAH